MSKKVAIIGAGPAGLTAAYLLAKAGIGVVVFEKDAHYVGGISRTEKFKGYHFDIGGHRFFSKSKEVEDFWTEILGDEMLERPRSSRIYYNGKFFTYPLAAMEALQKLGVFESARCMLSYLKAKLFPIENPLTFEDWVSNQFGKRLFQIFFKTYTEKVWGISCNELSADWAAQRIKGLSLSAAIRNALVKRPAKDGKRIKTLIDSFRYPKKGPGMMWERCAEKCVQMGASLQMGAEVNKLLFADDTWSIGLSNGESHTGFDYVISSAPIRELVQAIYPALPATAVQASQKLSYRDFLTAVLICKADDAFTDNWIYIHDPKVKVGRIQNFKSWSPYMIPEEGMSCYGLEYFCFKGDQLWESSDEELVELAKREMSQIGLIKMGDVREGYIVRQPKAYPVYDQDYKAHLKKIREAIKAYPGLCLVGRNGMHMYNNQDHSMMTAMLTSKNIIAGKEIYDVWTVNEDAEYHEGGNRGESASTSGQRDVPIPMSNFKD